MFWNSEEKRFGWPLIILAVYSTIFLVAFDLIWRLMEIGFVKLAAMGGIFWLVGAVTILVMARRQQSPGS